MKFVAALVFVIIACASGSPSTSVQQRGWLLPNIGISNVVSAVYNSIADKTVGKDSFLAQFKEAVEAKAQSVGGAIGDMTANQVGILVHMTFELLQNNKIIPNEDVSRYIGTFTKGFFKFNEPVVLTVDEVDKLQITGDAGGAAVFRARVKALILAKENGQSNVRSLAGLEIAAVDLLSANGIFQKKGALDIKNFFNLCELDITFC